MNIRSDDSTTNFSDKISKLQNVYTRVGVKFDLDLLQVAVLGEQFAGKSSIIERIVGCEFVPRGHNIVTARPLIVHLRKCSEEYQLFEHKHNTRFTDFQDVYQEIENETTHYEVQSKDISHVPINLHIFSPNLIDLTLIDLPAITQAINQPADFENRTLDVILQYISNENCLILAVIPANEDIISSNAMKLAREVDPQGLRTIGVITKVDLLNKWFVGDVCDILDNKALPLQHGYFVVVNNFQKYNDINICMKTSLQEEREFFTNDKVYANIADKCGIYNLKKYLNEQSRKRLRCAIFSLRDEFLRKVNCIESEINILKDLQIKSSRDRQKLLFNQLKSMQDVFKREIYGTRIGNKSAITDRHIVGVLVGQMLIRELPMELTEFYNSDKNNVKNLIQIALTNSRGISVETSQIEKVFQLIVRSQIAKVDEPLMVIVNQIIRMISELLSNCIQEVSCYPRLYIEVQNQIMNKFYICQEKLRKQISLFIDSNVAYINTKHEDFISSSEAQSFASSRAEQEWSDIEQASALEHIMQQRANQSAPINTTNKTHSRRSYWSWKPSMKKSSKVESKVNGQNFDSNSPIYTYPNEVNHSDNESVYRYENIYKKAEDNRYMNDENLDSEILQARPTRSDIEQALMIEILVESYMKIFLKTVAFQMPKLVTHLVVESMLKYFDELLEILLASRYFEKFLIENYEEESKHDDLCELYDQCKVALHLMTTI